MVKKPFKSGFVLLIGQTSVGKSSLLNRLLEADVSIVAKSNNTTRFKLLGTLTTEDYQLILVDTPGMHVAKSAFGEGLNNLAKASIDEGLDVVVLVLDSSKGLRRLDIELLEKYKQVKIVVLNKIDLIEKQKLLPLIARISEVRGDDVVEIFPVSAKKGDGVSELRELLVKYLPEGPMYFDPGQRSNLDKQTEIAEKIREIFLKFLKQELPHDVATLVTDYEWPWVRCEIFSRTPSQRAILIGHNGSNLARVRNEIVKLYPGIRLKLKVKVDKDWPSKTRKFGYLT